MAAATRLKIRLPSDEVVKGAKCAHLSVVDLDENRSPVKGEGLGGPLSRKRKDYYAVLGVTPKAHAMVIEEAYWDQAFLYHSKSHRSRRAARRLQLLNEAYETLGSPARRLAYDRARRLESATKEQRGRSLFHTIGRLLARMSQA